MRKVTGSQLLWVASAGSLAFAAAIGGCGSKSSGNSTATANDTGFNFTVQDQGAAVDLANGSDAYATNAGSGSDIIGTGTTAVTSDTNLVGNGLIESVTTSNAYEIDGLSYTTFLSDLFGFGGAAAETTAFADLMGLF